MLSRTRCLRNSGTLRGNGVITGALVGLAAQEAATLPYYRPAAARSLTYVKGQVPPPGCACFPVAEDLEAAFGT